MWEAIISSFFSLLDEGGNFEEEILHVQWKCVQRFKDLNTYLAVLNDEDWLNQLVYLASMVNKMKEMGLSFLRMVCHNFWSNYQIVVRGNLWIDVVGKEIDCVSTVNHNL